MTQDNGAAAESDDEKLIMIVDDDQALGEMLSIVLENDSAPSPAWTASAPSTCSPRYAPI